MRKQYRTSRSVRFWLLIWLNWRISCTVVIVIDNHYQESHSRLQEMIRTRIQRYKQFVFLNYLLRFFISFADVGTVAAAAVVVGFRHFHVFDKENQ